MLKQGKNKPKQQRVHALVLSLWFGYIVIKIASRLAMSEQELPSGGFETLSFDVRK
jgi:hypothetical protein